MTPPSMTTDTNRHLVQPLLTVVLMLWGAVCMAEDDRLSYQVDSPVWLQAVGKLIVPGIKTVDGHRTHHLERCSATLVAGERGQQDIIVTAWHCLERYSDVSKPIMFTLLPGSERAVESQAYRLADGGGMHADWAILRLKKPVSPLISPLGVNEGGAKEYSAIMMAGFSSDPGIGNHGTRLSYDPNCQITRQSPLVSDSDCKAFKGASGGAVVQTSQGQVLLAGVVSEGNGAQLSTFVPVSRFRHALNRYLR
ncbi:MAG: trypsin-like peptidase domain-containing protein [Halioglobus sp.]